MAERAPQFTLEHLNTHASRWLQRRQLLWSAGLGVVSVTCVVLSMMWIWPALQETQDSLHKLRQEATVSTQRAALLTNITAEDQQNFVRIAQALPPTKEPLVILQALEDIAQESSVTLSQFDTNPGLVSTVSALPNRGGSGIPTQNVVVSAELSGTFAQITQALERIESSAPVMEVTELSLRPDNRDAALSDQAIYNAEVAIMSFFYPPVAAGPGNSIAKALTSQQQSTLLTVQSWRNRLPEPTGTPPAFTRTNLFILEAVPPTPATFPVEQTQPDGVTTESSTPEESAEQTPAPTTPTEI